MAYMLRPKLPTGSSFTGQIVYNSTDFEVDTTLRNYIESAEYEVISPYIIKNTGFDKKKYKVTDGGVKRFSIFLVGNLSFEMHQILLRLAIAVNGAGMILEFRDSFLTGDLDTPITYNCRWVNAGDFVANSELFYGGSIDLVTYTLPENEGRSISYVFDSVVDAPASGHEWDLQVNSSDADYEYYVVP
jgi:hypothetical protein